jgi:dTDP-4-dehydrorhamnose reductase
LKRNTKKQILILGGTGMLGSACFKYFLQRKEFVTYSTSRKESNKFLTCKNAYDLRSILSQYKIDYVINCIGIIKPYINEQNQESLIDAIRMNSLFPHEIAHVAKLSNTRIIQIATDCVFSGRRGKYIEPDIHDYEDFYGKTKSLGEVSDSIFLNLRSSIIGQEIDKSSSLLEWFLNQSPGKVNGFTNHFWNGITTYHFGVICAGIILNDLNLSGTQHLVPNDFVTKAELLQMFQKIYGKYDVEILSMLADNPVDRTLSTTNVETNTLLWQLGGYDRPPSIETMLLEYAKFNLS